MVKKKKTQDAVSKGQSKISNFFSKAAPSNNVSRPVTLVEPVAPIVIDLDSDDDDKARNHISSGDSDCISPSPVKPPPARKRKRRGETTSSTNKKTSKQNRTTPVKRLKFPEKVLTPERIKECVSELLGVALPFKIDVPGKDTMSAGVVVSSPNTSSTVFRELNDNTSPQDQVVTTIRTKRSVSHKLFDDTTALSTEASCSTTNKLPFNEESTVDCENLLVREEVSGVISNVRRSVPKETSVLVDESTEADSAISSVVTKSPTSVHKSPFARSPTVPFTSSCTTVDVGNISTDTAKKLSDITKTDTMYPTNGLQPIGLSTSSSVNDALKCSSPRKTYLIPVKAIEGNDKWLEELCLEEWAHLDQPEETTDTGLDLQCLQRCAVLKVTQPAGTRDKVLLLESTADGTKTTCLLRESWAEYGVQVGDVVSVQAVRLLDRQWCVDSRGGLLVINPDKLISGTTVVGSLFCQRRSVLATYYKGCDPASKEMVVGILVHDLLQKVLQRKLTAGAGVTALAKRLMKSPQTVSLLYSAGLPLDATLATVLEFVPPITAFVASYCQPRRRSGMDPRAWDGEICEIQDIEENVWAPLLGLKGKIDLTAEVQVHGTRHVVPLEIKTGRASCSAEHKGQVMLYDMMMRETGRDPGPGLLVYIRSGLVEEVRVRRAEQAGLVHLRNRLSEFLCATVGPPPPGEGFKPLHLPKPINHHNACARCPYLTVCSTFLKREGLESVSEHNPLRALVGPATSHLTQQDVDYFTHWTGLLLLEDTEALFSNQQLADMWTLDPAEREARGGCISNLHVVDHLTDDSGRCLYTLRRDSPLHASRLAPGDYVALSTSHRTAAYTGTLTSIAEQSISVATDRSIRHPPATIFHVDIIDNYVSSSLNLTFLSSLMDDTPRSAQLRRSIVDKAPPTFGMLAGSIALKCADLFSALNTDQRTAVLKVLAADEYVLVKGMPGCGKTATIAALVAVLVRLGRSVLIVSHTHSAVDNVLLKVRDSWPEIELLRLGKTSRVHADLQDCTEAAALERCATPEALEAALNARPVVATTCLGANHPLFGRRTFSVCVVDESTQALQPTVLRSLLAADKFVLVGDPDQLPPVVRNKHARTLGMSESLFARLDGVGATVALTMQYRMNGQLAKLANTLTYGGRLRCADERVAEATLRTSAYREEAPAWLQAALSPQLEYSAVFLDTGRVSEMPAVEGAPTEEEVGQVGDQGNRNLHEGGVVLALVGSLLDDGGMSASDVGVIAPFRSQVALLRRLLASHGVEVNTVDQFQGRDKEVIVYSCTRSTQPQSKRAEGIRQATEILGDKRRLTVAVTRAKHKLVVVGDAATLRHYDPFACLLDCIDQVMSLTDHEQDFDWASVVGAAQQVLTPNEPLTA